MINQNVNSIVQQGLFHLRAGQLALAENQLSSALKLDPRHADALHLLGVIYNRQGRTQEALQLMKKAIKRDPKFAPYHRTLGLTLSDIGDYEEAIRPLKKALLFDKKDVSIHNDLAIVYLSLGRMDEAIKEFQAAIKKAPEYAEAHNNLGNAFAQLSRHSEAIRCYQRAVELQPTYAEAFHNLANTLNDARQLEEALSHYEKAIQLKPKNPVYYSDFGKALRTAGRINDALKNYETAIKIKPDYVGAYYNRGNAIKKYQADDPTIEAMKSLYEGGKLSDFDKKLLAFALSKVAEDLGDKALSFTLLAEGNRLRKIELGYTIEKDRKSLSQIKALFSATNSIPTLKSNSDDRKKPFFIVGMPRSGTSLVEQILASHSLVHGAGELRKMGQLAAHFVPDLSNRGQRSKNRGLTKDNLLAIHKGYLDYLDGLDVPEAIVTDKMPLNFRWIGFILSAFPEAKIVNLNRDPVAVCWSIFKRHFPGNGNGYAYDLADLADYYGLYLDLMDHWRKLYPAKIYDIHYERLTENQEAETRKLLDYCKLDWEDQCLDFHKTERSVKTASATQVREKMYKGSSEAWRDYESELKPLIDGLHSVKALSANK